MKNLVLILLVSFSQLTFADSAVWNGDIYSSRNPNPFEVRSGFYFSKQTMTFLALTPKEVYCNSGLNVGECVLAIQGFFKIANGVQCARPISISLTKGHRAAGFAQLDGEIGYIDFDFSVSARDRAADLAKQLKTICQ